MAARPLIAKSARVGHQVLLLRNVVLKVWLVL